MKAIKPVMLAILAVLASMTVALAQKPVDVGPSILVDPSPAVVNQDVAIYLFVKNMSARDVTIREIELYCGMGVMPSGWEEVVSVQRVTILSGETVTVEYSFRPETVGTWTVQPRLCLGGGGKRDVLGPPTRFEVTAAP